MEKRPDRLVVASANPDKIAEVEKIWEELGVGSRIVRGLSWEDVEETGETLEENALLKARAVAASTGLAVAGRRHRSWRSMLLGAVRVCGRPVTPGRTPPMGTMSPCCSPRWRAEPTDRRGFAP